MSVTQRKSSSVLIGSCLIGYGSVLLSAVCVGLFVMVAAHQVGAMQVVDQADPLRPASATVALVENPELTVRVLENLLRSILYSAAPAELQPLTNGAQKRGIDLGISRGFSGSQAGKHLMGLSAASFANGPGRR